MNPILNDPKNDTPFNVVIFSRVSSESQDNDRQIHNLKSIAENRNWNVRRTFQEKVSGTLKAERRPEYQKMLKYIKDNQTDVVMVSEVSRISRKVSLCMTTLEEIHELGVALYVQQFNMLSIENKKENPIVMMLFGQLALGAYMENALRKERQTEGIKMAKLRNPDLYSGKKRGARMSQKKMLERHSDINELLNNSSLSIRKIASITGKSINTVRKIKALNV